VRGSCQNESDPATCFSGDPNDISMYCQWQEAAVQEKSIWRRMA